MPPIIFKASNYLVRSDCEAHIMSSVGSDIDKNKIAGHQITGTKEELGKLQLSDETSVWGVKCVIIDFSTEKGLREKNPKWK